MKTIYAFYMSCLVLVMAIVGFGEETPVLLNSIRHHIRQAENNDQLSQTAIPLAATQDVFYKAIEKAADERILKQTLLQQFKSHCTPENLVPLFLQQINRVQDRDQKDISLRRLGQYRNRETLSAAASGGISGRVLVDGVPPQESVEVFAFDRHGYFCGSAGVSAETGDYTIYDLPSDSFYVVTSSQAYVDELYDDVTAPLESLEAWRDAKKVFVPAAVVENINFSLESGTVVYGSVTGVDDAVLEDGTSIDFSVTSLGDSTSIFETSAVIEQGGYKIVIPTTGRFKIKAETDGYLPAWYPDQSSWQSATVVEISQDSVKLDFKVKPASIAPTGEISGEISPALFVISAAFDVRDTSFVGMGISLGFLAVQYTIPNLPAGDYLVYADDYLGTLLGGGNALGEFYDGAEGTPFISKAKPVTVTAGQPTPDINFALGSGATVKGTITDYNSNPLDSLTVVLLNSDLLNGEGPFLNRFELHIISTDFAGKYEIPGLRGGTYFLRTVSDIFVNFNLVSPDSILLDGKHKGKVVDQFADGEQNLFRILSTQPVTLAEQETIDLSMQLSAPHFISGSLVEAESGQPITDVLVAALDDTSGHPWFPFASIDSLGQYTLGPLPQGLYKVLALTGFNGETDYLSEFYQDQRSYYTADVIPLNQERVENINFVLEKGATIQGFVHLNGSAPLSAGADTLEGMPVVVYHAENGKVASYDHVQFNGGYRIDRLMPGEYKVAVVMPSSDYSTTFLGGGVRYDAVENSELSLTFGDVTSDQIILVNQASGTITGVVSDSATLQPLSGVLIAAYDPTGHIAGYDLTDFDPYTGRQESTTGQFAIRGLAPGDYYVRTVSLFTALNLVEDVLGFLDLFENLDLFGLLFGGNIGGGLSLDLSLYKDKWFTDVDATMTFSLDELLFQAGSYALANEHDNALSPIFLPLPFYEPVDPTAQLLQINSEPVAVNFVLAPGTVQDIITDVYRQPRVPGEFSVAQNHPNPFNPSTTLSFSLPKTEHVTIQVVDILGRKIRELTDRPFAAGRHSVTWNGKDEREVPVAAGVYIAVIKAGDSQLFVKMLLVK